MTRSSIVRLAAVFLLLLTGVELFTCEAFATSQCEGFGAPNDDKQHDDDDKCVCCCAHVIVAELPLLAANDGITGSLDPLAPPKAELHTFSVYHPPKV